VFAHVDADIHQALIHQIYGTPTFVINGFKAESLDQTTTFAQWTAVIDSLLSSTNTAAVPLAA
jgi:protein-disulfide isomerase